MKKATLFIAIFLAFSLPVFCQDAGLITGHWLTEEGTSQVQIYKAHNGKYYGKITWLEEPNENGAPKKDKENPDPSLQNRSIKGLIILKGF